MNVSGDQLSQSAAIRACTAVLLVSAAAGAERAATATDTASYMCKELLCVI